MDKQRQPRIKTIPPAKHKNYALMWDMADEMARESGKPAEACWLQLIAAFWTGKLSKKLFRFAHPKGGAVGHVLVAWASRDVLAKHLLGHQRNINADAFGELAGWTLNDYQKEGEPFCRNPSFGLAVPRTNFQRWYRQGRDVEYSPSEAHRRWQVKEARSCPKFN